MLIVTGEDLLGYSIWEGLTSEVNEIEPLPTVGAGSGVRLVNLMPIVKYFHARITNWYKIRKY